MATYLIHDTRVEGNSPRGLADHTMTVSSSTSVQSMISNIADFAVTHGGTISHLYILAHGNYQNFHADAFSMSFTTGGCGIQICREGLTIGNLSLLARWRGKISRITLFSCGIAAVNSSVRGASAAARSGGGAASTRYDGVNGEYFCQQFAEESGAIVVASDLEQEYSRHRNPIDIYITGNPGDIDTESLLDMEGNIRTFRPTTFTPVR